jgi:hypothetical protein
MIFVGDHQYCNMLQIKFGHFISLAVLLLPGIVSGVIVSWKTRSPLALFFTIGSSLVGSFSVSMLGRLLWQLIGSFITNTTSNNSLFEIRSDTFPLLIAPTGLITGAALSGMLLLVDYELKRKGKKLDFFSVVVASISGSITGSMIALLSLIPLSWANIFLLKFLSIFLPSPGGDFALAIIGLNTYYILLLLSSLVCGLISAVFGMKLASVAM